MKHAFRAVAVGVAVLAAGAVVVPSPAHANTSYRDATFSVSAPVGDVWVQHTAHASYEATPTGVATVACNAVALSGADVLTSYCWLADLDSSDSWNAWVLPYLQTSNNVGTFQIEGPRRLQLCMRVSNYTGTPGDPICIPVG